LVESIPSGFLIYGRRLLFGKGSMVIVKAWLRERSGTPEQGRPGRGRLKKLLLYSLVS
jgi:hypothetical protein